MRNKGFLVVISAPSGGGKTTILHKILERDKDFRYSISATTRNKRVNEIHGQDYFFLTVPEFKNMIAGNQFIEWAEVHGNYYGTPLKPIEDWMAEGRLVFSDLDVDGGIQVKEKLVDRALLIFVKPPSYGSLLERLQARNTETAQQIEKRLSRYPKEMEKGKMYDFQVTNENLNETIDEILEIIKKHCN